MGDIRQGKLMITPPILILTSPSAGEDKGETWQREHIAGQPEKMQADEDNYSHERIKESKVEAVQGSLTEEDTAEEDRESPQDVEKEIIRVVFDKFVDGYNAKDIDKYLSAFWKEGFLYHSSQGTDDPSDDVEFTDLEIERRSALSIFERYSFVNLEVWDLEVKKDETDPNRARVKFRYSITCRSGRLKMFFCEGEGIFLMERRIYLRIPGSYEMVHRRLDK